MVEDRPIRGVLFDSGGVLVHPIGGRWNPRYDFEDILLTHHPDTPVGRFPEAFAAGQRLLDADPTTTANRTDYHRAMLAVLGIDAPSTALLRELEAPAAGPVVEVSRMSGRCWNSCRRGGGDGGGLRQLGRAGGRPS